MNGGEKAYWEYIIRVYEGTGKEKEKETDPVSEHNSDITGEDEKELPEGQMGQDKIRVSDDSGINSTPSLDCWAYPVVAIATEGIPSSWKTTKNTI